MRIRQSTSPIASISESRADVDPQVHRIEGGEGGVRALRAHLALEIRLDVPEEEHACLLRLGGELRLEVGEDVELRVERVAVVEVPGVAARPEERLPARHALDVVGRDAASVEDAELLVAEVLADDAHDAHVREEARREREMGGRAPEQAITLAERSLDRVERDGTDDDEGHERAQA